MKMPTSDLKNRIRNVPDFPKKGIQFKDITTLLSDPASFQQAIDLMGAALAYKLGTGVLLVRKPGKLPRKTVSASYSLEYGKDDLEIHEDAIRPGMKVLVADDVLATGGTVSAVLDMLKKLGADVVECCFLAELTALKGREQLKGQKVFSLIQFDD